MSPTIIKKERKGKKNIYIMGNWKMNPATAEEAKRIIAETKKIAPKLNSTKIVLFPPAVFAHMVVGRTQYPFQAGVQNIYVGEVGSHTGEMSASMVKSVGLSHVIVGHSERRAMG